MEVLAIPAVVPSEVSVVIPSWNDHVRLRATLAEYVPVLESSFKNFEVIVVSDGEKEPTSKVVVEYAQRGVTLIESPRRLGKGGAVLTGLRKARFGVAGFVDADGPIPPGDLIRVIQTMVDSDAAIASRALPTSTFTNPRSPIRRLFSRGWNLMVRASFGLSVHDTQCGAKFFRRGVLQGILNSVVLSDWAFDVSILYHLARNGARIVEVPVTWRTSNESKVDLPSVVPMMLISLAGIRLMGTRFGSAIPESWISWFLNQATRS
jgi:dolichol-phosphate mannosyltransferase